MDREAELQKIADGVRTLLCKAVDNISDMVKELRDEGLTDASTQRVDAANTFVATYDSRELVKQLISKHKRWERVLQKDMKFYEEDVPELLNAMPDVKVLAEPVIIYQKHKAEGFKNYEGGEKDFPLGKEDFDAQWVIFERIIKGACAYNMKLAKPDPVIMQYNPRVGIK